MLIDISIPLSAFTPPWPGDTPFTCGWNCRRESGDSVNLGTISTSAHVGTHADAPLHVESDWGASESLPPSVFIGDALVIALPPLHDVAEDVSATQMHSLWSALVGEQRFARVLLRTGCSIATGVFPADWPVLTPDAVHWLMARGVQLFGVDAPSVDRFTSKTLPIHHALFAAGAFNLENLSLAHVSPGVYELLAQPLSIHGADAAPVRALLRARSG